MPYTYWADVTDPRERAKRERAAIAFCKEHEWYAPSTDRFGYTYDFDRIRQAEGDSVCWDRGRETWRKF